MRVNYDQSITPTLLFHAGVGYIQQYQPTDYPEFDQGTLGMKGYFQTNRFPSIGGFFDGANPSGTNIAAGLQNFISGGYGGPGFGGIGPAFIAFLWEEKPTANISLTWVKGNHSFKYGGDLTIDGYPERSGWRANGAFGINNAETSDPWQNLQPFNFAVPTGFSYASFMLGLPDDIQISPNTQTKTGQHIHIILDNMPYVAHYDATKAWVFKNVPQGTHTIRAFPSRPFAIRHQVRPSQNKSLVFSQQNFCQPFCPRRSADKDE
jgi:hypothetical protein